MSVFDSETDPRIQILHMKKIQMEGLELFIRKNSDYGDSYKQHGLIGVLVRLQDKINRAMHISRHSIHVKDESLRDTLIDLHNYAAMAIMELESESEPLSLPIRTYGSEPPSDMVPIKPYSSEHIRRSISDTPYPNHCINLRY